MSWKLEGRCVCVCGGRDFWVCNFPLKLSWACQGLENFLASTNTTLRLVCCPVRCLSDCGWDATFKLWYRCWGWYCIAECLQVLQGCWLDYGIRIQKVLDIEQFPIQRRLKQTTEASWLVSLRLSIISKQSLWITPLWIISTVKLLLQLVSSPLIILFTAVRGCLDPS